MFHSKNSNSKLMFGFSFDFTQQIWIFDIFSWKQWVWGWGGWGWHASKEEEEEGGKRGEEGDARKPRKLSLYDFWLYQLFLVRTMPNEGRGRSWWNEESFKFISPYPGVQVQVLRQSKIDCLVLTNYQNTEILTYCITNEGVWAQRQVAATCRRGSSKNCSSWMSNSVWPHFQQVS